MAGIKGTKPVRKLDPRNPLPLIGWLKEEVVCDRFPVLWYPGWPGFLQKLFFSHLGYSEIWNSGEGWGFPVKWSRKARVVRIGHLALGPLLVSMCRYFLEGEPSPWGSLNSLGLGAGLVLGPLQTVLGSPWQPAFHWPVREVVFTPTSKGGYVAIIALEQEIFEFCGGIARPLSVRNSNKEALPVPIR